jgi:hypothetical protein
VCCHPSPSLKSGKSPKLARTNLPDFYGAQWRYETNLLLTLLVVCQTVAHAGGCGREPKSAQPVPDIAEGRRDAKGVKVLRGVEFDAFVGLLMFKPKFRSRAEKVSEIMPQFRSEEGISEKFFEGQCKRLSNNGLESSPQFLDMCMTNGWSSGVVVRSALKAQSMHSSCAFISQGNRRRQSNSIIPAANQGQGKAPVGHPPS